MAPVTAGQALILVLGGLAAGFINTLAGGGSAITIPILTEMVGISPNRGGFEDPCGIWCPARGEALLATGSTASPNQAHMAASASR